MSINKSGHWPGYESIFAWTAAAITNLEQRENVDGYETQGKSRTTILIESGLFLTEASIFFPTGPYISHSSLSRHSNRASCSAGVFAAETTSSLLQVLLSIFHLRLVPSLSF